MHHDLQSRRLQPRRGRGGMRLGHIGIGDQQGSDALRD